MDNHTMLVCLWGGSLDVKVVGVSVIVFCLFNSCFRVIACVRGTGFCYGCGESGWCMWVGREKAEMASAQVYRCLPCACCQHTPSPSASLKVGGAGRSNISLPHQGKCIRIDLVNVNNSAALIILRFVCRWCVCVIMARASGEKRSLFKTAQAAKRRRTLCRSEGLKSKCRIEIEISTEV